MAYSTRSDIETRFGVENVKRWGDLDNDGNPGNITARITAAIVSADATIDDATRNGIYSVPWSTVPEGIKNASRALAAVWLYQSRPSSDHEEGKGFADLEASMMAYLDKVRTGIVRFNIASNETVPFVSQVEV